MSKSQTLEQLERELSSKYKLIRVAAHSLDEDMRPDFALINCACPAGLDGHCGKCKHFKGFLSEDGVVASYMTFPGFCDPPNNRANKS